MEWTNDVKLCTLKKNNNLQKLESISLTFFKSEKLKSIISLKKNQTIKLNLIAYRISFNRFRLHMKIPHFDGQIIPRDHVAPRIREFDVRYGWDYFGEETAIRWIFRLLEDYGWEKKKIPQGIHILELNFFLVINLIKYYRVKN